MSAPKFIVDWPALGRALIEWVDPYADAVLVWLSDAQYRVSSGASTWVAEVPDAVWLGVQAGVAIGLMPVLFRVMARLVDIAHRA